MIDRKTQLKALFITIPDSKKFLESMKKHAEKEGLNSEKKPKETKDLLLTDDIGSVETDEYYFDSDEKQIVYNGTLHTADGDSYISFYLPISDVTLIDILNYALKKLNKLKTAMEALK